MEFMLRLGPSVSHHFKRDERGTFYALEFAIDFMFWPTTQVGWFV